MRLIRLIKFAIKIVKETKAEGHDATLGAAVRAAVKEFKL